MKIFDFILILSSIISSIWLILQIIYYKYSFLYNRFINLYNNKKEQKDDIYYSIIVAIKNENRDVIKQLIDNLKELNWKKYEVIIISDDDEKKFNEIFNGISIPYNFKIIRRDNPKDGKAGALNLGCKEAKGTYLVFLDADARIEKDFLIKLTNKIEKINALRLEIRNHNEGIIPKIYSSMNEFVMNSLFKGRHVLGLPIFPNGSALVIEKSVLENIGFWKSQVTEDLELGIRLFYNNYKVNYIDEVKVSVLAPYTNSDLYRQIERWAYGSGELFLTSLKLIKRGLNGIEAFFYISQWFINSLFF
ncbi:MAG: glycosyltransferase family 2 protein, partial [Sulfolobales archaeon]